MSPSPKLVEFLQAWEGLRLKPYQDAGGHWTVGYGCRLPVGWPTDVAITQDQCDELFEDRLSDVAAGIESVIDFLLTQFEFDACCSLVYNIGQTAFANSTLLRRLNAADIDGAANEFLRWNKTTVDGKLIVIIGLSHRRLAERKIFTTGVYDQP